MGIQNRFLFNFAASYSGGGLKRLWEYARWFNKNGGAWFIIHPNCVGLTTTFPRNHYFLGTQSSLHRLFHDCAYLKAILPEIGPPELYYSYGIPIYFRIGSVNWFHLSNVLPLVSRSVPLSPLLRWKADYLGQRIRRNYSNADVVSAESGYSLGLIKAQQTDKLFLSVNGSDDELAHLQSGVEQNKDDIVTVVGTIEYKALEDSFCVFEMLRRRDGGLRLYIVGNEKAVPRALRKKPGVVLTGVLQRDDVVECLRKSRYYVSTTLVENSYNAASEGLFLSEESYISDIGPHRELLRNQVFEEVSVPNVAKPILHVRRAQITGENLKSWGDVISEMIDHVRSTDRT